MIVEALAVLAVAASPQRLALGAGASGEVQVTNAGSRAVVLDASGAGYLLDLHGRPRIGGAAVSGSAVRRWIRVVPRTLSLRPGERAALRVSALRPAGARPGDHPAVLLLVTRPAAGTAVRVRVRVGVVVAVRVPGRLVRRVVLGGLQAVRGRRLLRLTVANRGNVDEWIARGQLTLVASRAGHVLLRLQPRARRVLAGGRAVVELRLPGALRGNLRVVATLARPGTRRRQVVDRLRI
jgi:hypothetical protein